MTPYINLHDEVTDRDAVPFAMPVKYLHCELTGRVIDSRRFDEEANWNWISGEVASWCDCRSDDVDCIETDDGDACVVRGAVVVRIRIG